LGQAYFNNVQYADAEPELKLALEEDPNNPMANYELADILLREQKAREALPHLRIATAGNPQYLRSQIDLGKCYMALGDLEAAKQAFMKAAESNPSSKEPHYLLAKVYDALHQPEKQKEELETFQKLDQIEENQKSNTAEKEVQKP